MAIQSREQLKRYFRKGEYPTEEQFGALVDSMRHREEGVGLSEVEGLPEALNGKLGRGEAGTLRALLEEFGGFGALGFAGIDRESREVSASLPERMELMAALAGGSVGVVYNTVSGRFLLRVESPLGIKYHSYWMAVDGSAGRVASGSSDYRAGVLLMTVESGLGMFYTWQGAGEPRRLGYFGPVGEALTGTGALTPEVSVEHKGNSARIIFGAVGPDGEPGTRSAVIGAVGIKAGLMLPSHVGAIEAVEQRAGYLESRASRHEERFGEHETMISAADSRAEEACNRVESLEYSHAADLADVRGAIEELDSSRHADFNDIFNQACVTFPKEGTRWRTVIGGYDPENAPDAEHPYRLRKVWMTYEEAVAVLAAGRPVPGARGQYTNNTDIRTNLPAPGLSGIDAQFYPFYYCENLEVANADNMVFRNGIYGCTKLHTVNNLDDVYADNVEVCASATLVNLTIKRLTKSLSLRRNPLVSRESLEQITSNAANTSPIVITLHADTFSKVSGDTTNEAAASLAPEELAQWESLRVAAEAKSITFVEADDAR